MLQKYYRADQRPDGGAPTRTHAPAREESLVRACGASWKAASCKLDQKEEKSMFYVVDQWGIYIREFETREDAEWFCERWNKNFRFSEWSAQKAHVVEG